MPAGSESCQPIGPPEQPKLATDLAGSRAEDRGNREDAETPFVGAGSCRGRTGNWMTVRSHRGNDSTAPPRPRPWPLQLLNGCAVIFCAF